MPEKELRSFKGNGVLRMSEVLISGFADEIDAALDRQLQKLNELGMKYLSLRGADGKNIADYTLREAEEMLLPRLKAAGLGVSSLGSPIGKIDLTDEVGFARQLGQLDTLCQIANLLGCRYIRIFSFYVPAGGADGCLTAVAEKVGRFAKVAEGYGVKLLLENEKGVFGDTAARCRTLLDCVGSSSCRAAFDFANFVQCGEDTWECWGLLKEYVDYIHIKDAVFASEKNVLCGTGEGKIHELLRRAVKEEGYRGFLTLEPHLAVFDGLNALERGDGGAVIGDNGVKDGAEGFALQYRALCAILREEQITYG